MSKLLTEMPETFIQCLNGISKDFSIFCTYLESEIFLHFSWIHFESFVTYLWTYSTPVPKQPMQMVLSGHTNLIWSLMTAWKEKKIWFVCSLSEHSLPYCDCTASLHHCVPDSWISSSTLCLDICPVIMIFSIIWWITAAMLTWKM